MFGAVRGNGDGGLRIVFDPAIDGGGWPGPLGGRDAIAGEAWLGPMGLLARVETELGLGGVFASATERAADSGAAAGWNGRVLGAILRGGPAGDGQQAAGGS